MISYQTLFSIWRTSGKQPAIKCVNNVIFVSVFAGM